MVCLLDPLISVVERKAQVCSAVPAARGGWWLSECSQTLSCIIINKWKDWGVVKLLDGSVDGQETETGGLV